MTAHYLPLSFPRPIQLPQHVTYLVKLVGVVIAALKLLVKHTILLREDLHHLLGSLHNRKGIWSKLLAGGGRWRLWSCQAHGKRKRQGDGVQGPTDGGRLRGHGTMLLHRGWKGELAWPAVREERTRHQTPEGEEGRSPAQAVTGLPWAGATHALPHTQQVQAQRHLLYSSHQHWLLGRQWTSQSLLSGRDRQATLELD